MDSRGARDNAEEFRRAPPAAGAAENRDEFSHYDPFIPAHAPAGSAPVEPTPGPASQGRLPPEDELNVKFLGTHEMLFNKNAHQNTPYSYDEPERFAETSGLAFPQLATGRGATASTNTSPSVRTNTGLAPSETTAASNSHGPVDPYAQYWSPTNNTHNSATTPFLPQYSTPVSYQAETRGAPPILTDQSESYVPPPGEYYKLYNRTNSIPQSQPGFGSPSSDRHQPYFAPSDGTAHGLAQKHGSGQDKRICWLPARLFWIVLGCVVASLVMIAAVVGGVVGAEQSRRAGQSATEQGNSAVNRLLRSGSQISAVNWTDPSGNARHAVFTQDVNLGIRMSVKLDADNWKVYNVSKQLENAGIPIKPRDGSPLAAVVSGPPWYEFEMRLYYVDTDTNQVRDVRTKDVAYEKWERGDMPNITDRSRGAGKATQLGAVWHRCDQLPSCKGLVYLVYQDADMSLVLLNSSTWERTFFLGPQGVARSGVALTEFAESRREPSELRMHFDNKGSLSEFKYNNKNNSDWEGGSIITDNNAMLGAPKIVSTAYNQSANLLLLQNDADGTLFCHVWDQKSWLRNRRARFVNGPQNLKFSSLAVDRDQRLYGVEADQDGKAKSVHELSWNEADPLSFAYIGEVGLS